MLNQYPDVLLVKDVQKILRMGKNKVYHLLQEKKILSRKEGKKYFIPKQSVIDYINSIRYTTT